MATRTAHLLLALLLVAGLPVRLALGGGGHDHHGHNHEAAVEAAPRGGILRDSPPFKTELLLKGDLVTIYVYDQKLTPVTGSRLAATIQGELAFPKDRERRTVTFALAQDSYQATIPNIGAVHRYDLHIKGLIDGTEVLMDFGVDNIH